MSWRRFLLGALLAGAIIALTTWPARAQLFGKRTPPQPPRVSDLVRQLKEDGDENKRLDAVEALRALAHQLVIGSHGARRRIPLAPGSGDENELLGLGER